MASAGLNWSIVILLIAVLYAVETDSFEFKHHNYKSMTVYLRRLAAKCPLIFRLSSIGKSVEGRQLWVMRVTDHPDITEPGEPRLKYVGNMHGDEVVGREMLLYLLEHVCAQYGKNDTVTHLVDSVDIRILPSMNPDGYERTSSRSCGHAVGRTNAHKVDLNRNFPDQFFPDKTKVFEPETKALMAWIKEEPFVLSANFHGGSVVASYPFDDNAVHHIQGVYSGAPDNAMFKLLASIYANNHRTMWRGNLCRGDHFPGGITNGAQWYELSGGMEDYNYVHSNCFEITVELSCCKFPPAQQLPAEWLNNRDSLLAYMQAVHRGVKGFVRDRISSKGIPGAVISVKRINHDVVAAQFGDYWRLLPPGKYLITAHAPGYDAQTKEVTVPDCNDGVTVDFSLRPLSAAAAAAAALPATEGPEQPLIYAHHNEQQLRVALEGVVQQCPDITKMHSLGTSVEGRHLWLLEFAREPGKHVPGIPEFKYIANMHGNEVVGREMLILLAEYFCDNYRRDDRVARLINTTRIHLLPTMNPDGYSRSVEGDATSVRGRANANQIDLNRNFLDHFHPSHTSRPRQEETRLVEEWIKSVPFVLSANLHGGDLVANYPFDDHKVNTRRTYNEPSPDDRTFRQLAKAYSFAHPTMHLGRPCPGYSEDAFKDGITNGASWYTVAGGMQDYNYFNTDCFEITIEMGCKKFPLASELQQHWVNHRPALLAFLEQVHIGVKGFITDVDGEPVPDAVISVVDIDHDVHSHKAGDYYRLLAPGTYELFVSAPGFMAASADVIVSNKTGPAVVVNFTLADILDVRRRSPSASHNLTKPDRNGSESSLKATVRADLPTPLHAQPLPPSLTPEFNYTMSTSWLCTSSGKVASIFSALESRCPSALRMMSAPGGSTAVLLGRVLSNSSQPVARLGLLAGFDRHTPEVLVRVAAAFCDSISATACDASITDALKAVHLVLVVPPPTRSCQLSTDRDFQLELLNWLATKGVLLVGDLQAAHRNEGKDANEYLTRLSTRITGNTPVARTTCSLSDEPPALNLSSSIPRVAIPLSLPCCANDSLDCTSPCLNQSAVGSTSLPDVTLEVRPRIVHFLASAFSRVQGHVHSESKHPLRNIVICSDLHMCTTSQSDGSYILLLHPGNATVYFTAGEDYNGALENARHSVHVPHMDVPGFSQTVYLNVTLAPPRMFGLSKSMFSFVLSLAILGLMALCLVVLAYCRSPARRRLAKFHRLTTDERTPAGHQLDSLAVRYKAKGHSHGLSRSAMDTPLMVDGESEDEFTLPSTH